MIIDFQHHFTPPELIGLPAVKNLSINKGGATPPYRMPAELTDITAHVRDMAAAGIDHAMLSCGLGMDGTTLEICRAVNDAMARLCEQSPRQFSSFAHTDPLGGPSALQELERCRHELGMRGAVIVSEPGGTTLDDPRMDAYWETCERLGMFVFVHPSLRPAVGATMNKYDLIRSLGREFSLAMSTVRLINGGVLDRFEGLRVQMGHLSGGLAVSMNRVRAMQDKERMNTVGHPDHGILPKHDFDHYLRERLWFDTAGVFGSMPAVRAAVDEFTPARIVFGTDYPLEILSVDDLSHFVEEIRALGEAGKAILSGNANGLLRSE
ncbi:amidohydrolase family protein [Hydrogenophaga sp. XSHU_21]